MPTIWGLPFPIWTLAWVALGLIVGSFLNVVIHRLPRGESVVAPPSHCPKCGTRIPLKYNLPIVSWLWLRGRCRFCGEAISPRYLGVEALTAFLFVLTWIVFAREQPLVAVALCVLFAGFIAATFIDLEYLIIPDEITLGGAVVGFLFSAFVPELHGANSAAEGLKRSGLGVVVGAGLVYCVLRAGKLAFGRQRVTVNGATRVVFHETGVVLPSGEVPYEDIFYRTSDTVRMTAQQVELADRCYANQRVELQLAEQPPRLRIGEEVLSAEAEPYLAVVTDQIDLPREAMGLGDVKFMAAIGAFLGAPATVFALFGSAVIGSAVALLMIALGRQKWSGRVGYGPYLAVASVIWVFGGKQWATAWFGPVLGHWFGGR
ncbi:MAG TPA: prepilin peptidase [Verrucomicrobiales bacterium]|nr:prepilin peptidase [Verrucomicrobiales bacterium]